MPTLRRPHLIAPLAALTAVAGVALGVTTAGAQTGGTTPTPAATPTPSPTATPTPAAPNPTPPKVTTSGAEDVSLTGAVLTASVNPNGGDTTFRFQYGTSAGYGLTSATTTVAAGTSAVAVKVPIASLTSSTQYHYRVVATNAAGSVNGGDRTFTTSSAPTKPSVATSAAANVTTTTATLVGRVNPKGQDTAYRFEYGTSSKYGTRTGAGTVKGTQLTTTVTAPVTGLKANTKYYLRVVATNKTGTATTTARTFTTGRGLNGVTIGPSAKSIAWDGTVTIGGKVGGAAAGGLTVALLRQDLPYTAPAREIATAKTSSSGAYGFTVRGIYNTVHLQVAVKGAGAPPASPVITLGAQVLAKLRVTKRKAKSVRLSGTVLPGLPAAARVSIQRKTPKGHWVRVKRMSLKTTASGKQRYSLTVKRLGRAATYRAVVLPNDGGLHVPTQSASVSVPRKK